MCFLKRAYIVEHLRVGVDRGAVAPGLSVHMSSGAGNRLRLVTRGRISQGHETSSVQRASVLGDTAGVYELIGAKTSGELIGQLHERKVVLITRPTRCWGLRHICNTRDLLQCITSSHI